jgi:hypothetical protein
MKKGLLLSLVASTVLFAGGDIAPVEPVAEAPAAACNDFYGHAGAGVIFTRDAAGTNAASMGVVAVLGVTKEIFSGVTFNAEVQGGSFASYNSAAATTFSRLGEIGALTQFNLGYSWCNTAIKVGRFAVPAKLSPLVATGTDYFGLKKATFEGALVANTDVPDTTLWAAYLYNKVDHADTTEGLNPNGTATATSESAIVKVNAVAGGFRNTSFADTVITAAGYYFIDSKDYKIAGSIDHKWCDTDLSVGGAYQKSGDYIAGATIQQNFDSSYIKIGATYGNMVYKKYTDFTNHTVAAGAAASWAIGAKAGTDWCGYKLWVAGDYQQAKTWEASVGVSKTFSGINFAMDYRYNSAKTHRVRAKAVYKF